jgi:8-hydroxy-5-deazaflavin:NADPH oxidoreductase
MKKIGILGAGNVGQILAAGFIADGYEVMVGSRNGIRAAELDEALGIDVAADSFSTVAQWGEIIILAVKGSAAEGVISDVEEYIKGKIVIDTTNPLSDKEPENGLVSYFLQGNDSLGEHIQKAVPESRIVKAWNTISYKNMIHPSFSVPPTMPLCGNDEDAKKEVSGIISSFGFTTIDMGGITSARALESLAQVLFIPGYLYGEWDTAFSLLRK